MSYFLFYKEIYYKFLSDCTALVAKVRRFFNENIVEFRYTILKIIFLIILKILQLANVVCLIWTIAPANAAVKIDFPYAIPKHIFSSSLNFYEKVCFFILINCLEIMCTNILFEITVKNQIVKDRIP